MMGSLFNHLWQSTLFAMAAGLLTLGFRRNRAQVRYWLWFSAILFGSLARDLNFAKKLLLAAPAACVLALSLVIGMVHASSARQTLEVASVKPAVPAAGPLTTPNMTAAALIKGAYGLQPIVSAQNQRLAFEVASVKPSPANRYIPAVVDPQRFWIVTTLAGAILWANDFFDRGYKLSGGPPWMHRDYYQFEGRTQAPATTKEMRTMLQTLLADRFKLKLHRESKEMSVYALITGTSGLKLQISEDQCGRSICGMDVGPGELIARYATMADLAATLGNMVDRPVLDETGLDAHYDVHMKFDPSLIKPYDGQPIVTPSPDAPSIFVAIQDLGLKLEPRRAAVEILVVDSADEPLPD